MDMSNDWLQRPESLPGWQADMSSEAEVERLVQRAVPAPDGRLHVFVNNAARFVFGEVTDVTEAQWDAALGTNVKGCTFIVHQGPLLGGTPASLRSGAV